MASKGTFDTLFDNLCTILETWSAAQIVSERFTVYKDHYRGFPATLPTASVFAYYAGFNPGQKAGRTAYLQFIHTYIFDLLANGTGTKGVTYMRGDSAANVRLRILIQQVLTALFDNSNPNFSLDFGNIARINNVSLAPLPPEQQEQLGEKAIASSRLSFNIELNFVPSQITGDDLEQITITADDWSAIIEPEQREE